MEVNIHQAKTHLSKLLRRAMAGEEIIIARAGVPIARLVPVQPEKAPFPLGIDEGAFEVPEDFDAPLPITHSHTLAVSQLLAHHRDPFDRLLIAQAQVEGMAILTADRAFQPYAIEIVWCGA